MGLPEPWLGRTVAVRMSIHASIRKRGRRLELHNTLEERALIRRAAAATGMEVTEFVVSHACEGLGVCWLIAIGSNCHPMRSLRGRRSTREARVSCLVFVA